jgi:TFIIH basal transcription factor complex TTD-A subunit
MKQFLLHLDDTQALGRRFVLNDLDENHLFINADIVKTLKDKIDELLDKISVPVAE